MRTNVKVPWTMNIVVGGILLSRDQEVEVQLECWMSGSDFRFQIESIALNGDTIAEPPPPELAGFLGTACRQLYQSWEFERDAWEIFTKENPRLARQGRIA